MAADSRQPSASVLDAAMLDQDVRLGRFTLARGSRQGAISWRCAITKPAWSEGRTPPGSMHIWGFGCRTYRWSGKRKCHDLQNQRCNRIKILVGNLRIITVIDTLGSKL